jgi:hypothetical protein
MNLIKSLSTLIGDSLPSQNLAIDHKITPRKKHFEIKLRYTP